MRRPGWTWPRRALVRHLDELGKGRDVAFYDLESASKSRHGRPGPRQTARGDPAQAVHLPARRCASGRAGGPPGPAGGGDRAGHRRPLERRRGPAPGGRVDRQAQHPDLPDRGRGEEGPRNVRLAEIVASPVVFATRPDDPGGHRRGPRAARRRGRSDPGAAGQQRRLAAGRQPADPPGRGRRPQADDLPDRAQGGGPVRVPCRDRGRGAGTDSR